MNILLLHQYFLEENDPGGSRWNEFTRIWTAQGHTVTVLGGMMHYNGKEKIDELQKKIDELEEELAKIEAMSEIARWKLELGELKKCIEKIFKE